jgi:NAD(P)-dependent dehydrogenase (short-subunit alcohol dehydrogenase family)
MDPRGKVVVVTGASSGVGRAIARALAQKGARVALLARGMDGLAAAAIDVEQRGGAAFPLSVDVADSEAVTEAAERIVMEWGTIDVWINNAMVSVFSPVAEMQAAEFARVSAVNYLGYVHGTLAALRQMRKKGAGLIIQIGSALAYRSIPLQRADCASTAAIRGFTDSLRTELLHERSRIGLAMVHLPAVNTPQFEVVRSRLDKHPQPVPPIYQPEVISRAVLQTIAHPRREVWVGWSTVAAILGQRIFPGWLDRYLARYGWDSQQTDDLPPGHPCRHDSDNVDRPLPGDRGAHGPFDNRARAHSSERWARLHVGWLLLGLGAAVWFLRRPDRSLHTRLRAHSRCPHSSLAGRLPSTGRYWPPSSLSP